MTMNGMRYLNKKLLAGIGVAAWLVLGSITTLQRVTAADDVTVGQAEPSLRYGDWGFDLSGLDPDVRPGDDFSRYADGAWEARTVIPADRSRYGAFEALRDATQDQLRGLIEAAAASTADAGSDEGKIGALYRSFMDEARVETLDAAPIADELAQIRNVKTKTEIAALMGAAKNGFGASLFVAFVSEDAKDPTHHTLAASQAGLGLPDRDYYLRDAFKDKKAKYRDYVAHMLDMAGWAQAPTRAAEIVALEEKVAQASWSRAESRDRDKTYNPMTPAELDADAPGFDWTAWLAAMPVGEREPRRRAPEHRFPEARRDLRRDAARDAAGLGGLQRRRIRPRRFCRSRFVDARLRIPRPRAVRPAGAAAALEARLALVEPRHRRSARPCSTSPDYFPPESKAKMEALVDQHPRGAARADRAARLDERRHQGEGAGEARPCSA